jgi:nucleotide-binding universal stress UspA family protein
VEAGKRIALSNILFATDFSFCSNSALPYALAMARRYGATVHAANVLPTLESKVVLSPDAWPAVVDDDDEQVKHYVENLEKHFQEVPHEILLPRGNVADVLAGIISDRDIDLVVLGTHGRSGIGKLFLGSVAEEIFRRASCPVLSVGPHVFGKPGSELSFRHILFATDFSEDSRAALPFAFSLAEEDEASLTLLHVVAQPEAGITDCEGVRASLLDRLQQLVPPEAESWCHTECRIEFGHIFEPPAETILQVAMAHAADLIVLGARAVQGKLGMATHLTSTTARILTQAICPVLTVRDGSTH